jgi:hypothetical protein
VKTEEWLAVLANEVEPVDSRRAGRRMWLACAMGLIVSMLFVAGVLRINPALSHEVFIGMFWVRGAFCATLALLAVQSVRRLGCPGVRLGYASVGLVLTVTMMWVLALVALLDAPAPDRIRLVLGRTAVVCPWLIALLAVPLFAALIHALRGMAPTRLRLAGAAAGFAAGAGGALVYTLHCPELAAPFIGTWYLLGMLIPSGLGAAFGPRLLRW